MPRRRLAAKAEAGNMREKPDVTAFTSAPSSSSFGRWRVSLPPCASAASWLTTYMEKKKPIMEKKRPIIEKKRPIMEKKSPVMEKKRPIIKQKRH
jgi:hypothetical protein